MSGRRWVWLSCSVTAAALAGCGDDGGDDQADTRMFVTELCRTVDRVTAPAVQAAATEPSLGTSIRVRDVVTIIGGYTDGVIAFLDLGPTDEIGFEFKNDPGCSTLRQMVATLEDPPSLDPTQSGGS